MISFLNPNSTNANEEVSDIKKLKSIAYEEYEQYGNLNRFFFSNRRETCIVKLTKEKIHQWELEFFIKKVNQQKENQKVKDNFVFSINEDKFSTSPMKKTKFFNRNFLKSPSKQIGTDDIIKIDIEKGEDIYNLIENTNKAKLPFGIGNFVNKTQNDNGNIEDFLDLDCDLIDIKQLNTYDDYKIDQLLQEKGKLLSEKSLKNYDFLQLLNALRLKKKEIEGDAYYSSFKFYFPYIYLAKDGCVKEDSESDNDVPCSLSFVREFLSSREDDR